EAGRTAGADRCVARPARADGAGGVRARSGSTAGRAGHDQPGDPAVGRRQSMRRAALVVMLALVLQPGCARAQEDAREALRTGRYDEAIAAFQRDAEAGDAEAMTALVRTLIEAGRYEAAERAVRE